MKKAKVLFGIILLMITGCTRSDPLDSMVAIQIQDRNGLTETISTPERLENYHQTNFLGPQPYKKIIRIYRNKGKSHSIITTYHQNGSPWQYLEAEELRAHGAYKEWYPNGQLRIDAYVIGGTADVAQGAQKDWLFHGKSKVWDEQGKLLAELPYDQGALEGTSLHYYPTGVIEKEHPYHSHILEGTSTEYHPNGSIRSKIAYKRGNKEGMSYGYFQNKQMAWEEEYRDNLILKGSYYNNKGELLSSIEEGSGFRALFDGDTLSLMVQVQQGFAEGGVKQFTSTGELQSTYHIKNGKKSGTETIYYISSERQDDHKAKLMPKLSINWEDNAVHGSVKTWYNTGQMQSQRDFCRNKKMGPSLSWYRDGSLMLVEEYEEDKLVKGLYYKKSALDAISSVINGSGIATLYDESGVFLRKISYLKGDPVDPNE